MLMIAGGVLLSRFWMAIRPPKVAVSLQEASSMAALGAAALAYSASRIASPSSPFTPGLLQLFVPLAGAGWICANEPPGYDESPNVERNLVQSAVVWTFVSSTTTMVCPCPDIPALKSGFKL